MATPHTRGSTHSGGSCLPSANGYPAYAGIDPCAVGCVLPEQGYPAYAGIDLVQVRVTSAVYRLPRIRGDRPEACRVLAMCCRATPHTRGSTSAGERSVEDRSGYPAYAGIDPASGASVGGSSGLPRIRGDRPALDCRTILLWQATPHTRGSTFD